MKVIFSPAAESDLEHIGDYIGQDNPLRSVSLIHELRDACDHLDQAPLGYALLPRYERKGLRRRPFGNYSIIYRVDAEDLQIVRILHAAQDLDTALN